MTPDNYLPLSFAHWYLQQTSFNRTFPASVSFTNEVHFRRSSKVNVHNSHLWGHDDPHDYRRKIKNLTKEALLYIAFINALDQLNVTLPPTHIPLRNMLI